MTDVTGGVWDELVGQSKAVAVLQRAVDSGQRFPFESRDPTSESRHSLFHNRHSMSHSWLFVGPPGSGRSNAARAFAAALQCSRGGCGQCNDCRTSLSGAHPDVTLLRTEQLSIGVDEVRSLVGRANMSPVGGRFQVVVVEDADRITERGADALLKSLEEPAPKTVWLLCAPSADDVIVTIRSRCRELRLVTPDDDAVTQLLIHRDGISPALAAHSARVAQGHIGRARMLARSDAARIRRREVLTLPSRLKTLTDCLTAAENLVKSSAEEAAQATQEIDARELAELQEAMGVGARGARPRNAAAAIRDMEDQQKMRAKRMQRDSLDRVLTELTGYFRDVLAAQSSPETPLINQDLADEIRPLADRSTGEQAIRAMDAILAARTALEGNVAPLLAMESLMVGIAHASRLR